MIRLTVPSLDGEEIEAVSEVLRSGYLVQGEHVSEFEKLLAEKVGVDYVVAVSSGTAALHLALLALNVHPGDLVLVPAYSWPATANVVELCGATPVFVDICSNTFNLDPSSLEKTLKRLEPVLETSNRIKAIIPVHTFGQMADMRRIVELADQYKLPIVEDAACSLGAKFDGADAGTFGKMGCFSLHPRKAITTGEGGFISTKDASLAKRLKALRNHGINPGNNYSDFVLPGLNYRMTEIQAAIGLIQLRKLPRIINARQLLANYYNDLLAVTFLEAPFVHPNCEHVYQSYVTLLPDDASSFRSRIIERMKSKGIEMSIGTWSIPLTTYYSAIYGYRVGDFPNTDRVFIRSLTIPLYETLLNSDQEFILLKLKETISELMG